MVTSSAVVGSSAMSRRGSQESAIAIIARWRRPPLNSNEYSSMRRSGFGIPTLRSASIPRSRASFLLTALWRRTASMIWSPTVCTGLKEVIGSWKMRPMSPPRIARISRLLALELDEVRLRPVGAGEKDLAVDDSPGIVDDAQDRLRRDALAAAALADDAERLAREDVEGGAVDGLGRSLVLKEARLQVPHRKQRLRVVRMVSLLSWGVDGAEVERVERSPESHLQVGVRRVPDAVAHEIEREHRDDDGNGRDRAARER